MDENFVTSSDATDNDLEDEDVVSEEVDDACRRCIIIVSFVVAAGRILLHDIIGRLDRQVLLTTVRNVVFTNKLIVSLI
jgi:hypothetical protein